MTFNEFIGTHDIRSNFLEFQGIQLIIIKLGN